MTQVNSPKQDAAGPERDRQTTGGSEPARPAQMPAAQPDVRFVEDRYIGQRAEHAFKPEGPLPPEEASHAGEAMTGELAEGPVPEQARPPMQDVEVTPEEPSVWEAAGKPRE